MSVESFIKAMPKVELGLQLEGTIPKETLLHFARVNGKFNEKGFNALVEQYEAGNAENIWEVLVAINQSIMYQDDLTRAVYDTGVMLSKQGIHYAEIGVSPVTYMQNGMSFENFIEALYDGADRAFRGWKIRINWLLTIPYSEPRRGDEIGRWTATATSKRSGVVGLALNGFESEQPAAQFERAFRNAEKRDIGRVVWAGDTDGVSSVMDALDHLSPHRIVGAWGIVESQDVLNALKEHTVAVGVLLGREKSAGRIETYDGYPLDMLRSAGLDVYLSAGMPEVFKTTITDELVNACESSLLTVEELEELMLNAIQISFMSDEDKQAMSKTFMMLFTSLKQQHLTAEE